MKVLLEYLGTLVHRIRGPSKTLVHQGQSSSAVKRIQMGDEELEVTLLSRRVVYQNQYVRKWVPDTKRCVYIVSCSVCSNIPHRIKGPVVEEVAYPMLVNYFLKWTDAAHNAAIDAYLDRMVTLLEERSPERASTRVAM